MEHTDNTLQWLKDKSEIIDTVLRFFYAMDIQNWTLLRSCLAETLDVDYTALRGEPRKFIFADDFVASRAKDLVNLSTQHISTNHLVSINPEGAECNSNFLIHRMDQAKSKEEKNSFDTAGFYTHGLVQSQTGWTIHSIKQTIIWNRGDSHIHGAFRRT